MDTVLDMGKHMRIHLKHLIGAIIIAFGAWCILWNPVEIADKELGPIGLTVLGIIILVIGWFVFKKKAF